MRSSEDGLRPSKLPELGVRVDSQANCARRESSRDARRLNRTSGGGRQAGEREKRAQARRWAFFEKMRRRIHTRIIAGRRRKNIYTTSGKKRGERASENSAAAACCSLGPRLLRRIPDKHRLKARSQRRMNFVLRPASTFPAKQSLRRLLLLHHESLFIYAQLRVLPNEMRSLALI